MGYLSPGLASNQRARGTAGTLARGAELYHELSHGLQDDDGAHPVAAVGPHRGLSVCGGRRDGFAELLRRENVDKGVDVVQADDALVIDVYVIVQYGIRISEVAHNLQETVKFEVERSVNVPVLKVNVNVQGVREERI
ncbi:MAG: Asp23/Gls24 family envelope stress response protein [Chloroflexi bacterium]|nr:MAG: Asp23/Gls24 family envelope stress response protein [Chloroflexota bacterium]